MTDHVTDDADDRSQLQRMRDGDPYVTDAEIVALQRGAIAAAQRFAEAFGADPEGAQELLRDLLGAFGEESHVRAPLYVDYGSNLRIGARTFANYGLMALDVAPIVIGDDCQIGPNVQLLTPTHPLEAGPRRDKVESSRPITIGDNVWLGGGVIVCPGVTIGSDTVVGAGAVVTRDLPPGVLALGNPARVVRRLED